MVSQMFSPALRAPQDRAARQRRIPRGFALLEILVVLVIMGMLTAVVAPQLMNMFSGAKSNTANLQIETLNTALNYYRVDTGGYPSMDQGLAALWKAPPEVRNWRGPYVRKPEHLLDPWGRQYRYRMPGRAAAVEIFSLGADDRDGGEGEDADVGIQTPR